MDVSSDESSYSAESMGSFDDQEWERFAGRRACSLVLSIYREKLLADGQLANRAITLSLDQHPSVLVDQDNLAIMNWAEQHLDAGQGIWSFFGWSSPAGSSCSDPLCLSRCVETSLFLLTIRVFLPDVGFLDHWDLNLK